MLRFRATIFAIIAWTLAFAVLNEVAALESPTTPSEHNHVECNLSRTSLSECARVLSELAKLSPLPYSSHETGESVVSIEDGQASVDPNNVRWLALLGADFAYRMSLLNALRYAERIGHRNIGIICYDHATAMFLQQHNWSCVVLSKEALHPYPATQLTWMFYVRHVIALRLLRRGISVLMSDTDAVWVRDPWPMLKEELLEGADLIVSRGKAPQVTQVTLGATWCMGFYFMRATMAMITVQAQLVANSKRLHKADQYVANRMLVKWGLRASSRAEPDSPFEWLTKPETDAGMKHQMVYKHSTKSSRVAVKVEQGSVRSRQLVMSFLPHVLVPRECNGPEDVKDAVVVHCQLSHSGSDKVEGLRALGAWALP